MFRIVFLFGMGLLVIAACSVSIGCRRPNARPPMSSEERLRRTAVERHRQLLLEEATRIPPRGVVP